MSPRYTPGKVKAPPGRPPHGSSQKVLTVKVKAHTRRVAAPKAAFNPNAQPITPGSGITAGQAARMASNAVTTRYGPQQQQLQQNIARNTQVGQDQAGWYDAYLRELQQHRDNIAGSEAASNKAVAGLADSLRSVDQSTLGANQQANNADAASRGATASAQTSTDANNASLVRQALMGSFGAELANRGKDATDYADTLAHVVGPGQKLQAQAGNARSGAELLQQLAGLKGQSGAYKQQFIDSLTQQEAKNVLAASIASGRDLTQQTRITETTRHDKAQEKIASTNPSKQKTAQQVAFFNKHGYYPPTGAPKAPAAAKKVKPAAGPGSLTQGQESHVVQAVKGARAAAQGLMSKPGAKSGEVRQLLAAGKVDGVKYTQDEINAAFDLLPPKYGGLGGLSPANVKALHRMGIHVKGVFPQVFGGVGTITPGQLQTVKGIYGLPK